MDKTPLVGIPWDGARDEFSLRDWFAGQALMGMLADHEGYIWNSYSYAAEKAYRLADEMIAARDAK